LTQLPRLHNLGVFGLLSPIYISALRPLKNDNCKVIKVGQFAGHPSGADYGSQNQICLTSQLRSTEGYSKSRTSTPQNGTSTNSRNRLNAALINREHDQIWPAAIVQTV
jgi:hypothetical protein